MNARDESQPARSCPRLEASLHGDVQQFGAGGHLVVPYLGLKLELPNDRAHVVTLRRIPTASCASIGALAEIITTV